MHGTDIGDWRLAGLAWDGGMGAIADAVGGIATAAVGIKRGVLGGGGMGGGAGGMGICVVPAAPSDGKSGNACGTSGGMGWLLYGAGTGTVLGFVGNGATYVAVDVLEAGIGVRGAPGTSGLAEGSVGGRSRSELASLRVPRGCRKSLTSKTVSLGYV